MRTQSTVVLVAGSILPPQHARRMDATSQPWSNLPEFACRSGYLSLTRRSTLAKRGKRGAVHAGLVATSTPASRSDATTPLFPLGDPSPPMVDVSGPGIVRWIAEAGGVETLGIKGDAVSHCQVGSGLDPCARPWRSEYFRIRLGSFVMPNG